MTDHETNRIAQLLSVLPPAPDGWVAAAQELPHARRTLDVLIGRAEADAELKARLVADLESTLAESGIAPTPRNVAAARERLIG
jgi:hypothetical protein